MRDLRWIFWKRNFDYEEIDRVYAEYPELNDDEFVKNHLGDWL